MPPPGVQSHFLNYGIHRTFHVSSADLQVTAVDCRFRDEILTRYSLRGTGPREPPPARTASASKSTRCKSYSGKVLRSGRLRRWQPIPVRRFHLRDSFIHSRWSPSCIPRSAHNRSRKDSSAPAPAGVGSKPSVILRAESIRLQDFSCAETQVRILRMAPPVQRSKFTWRSVMARSCRAEIQSPVPALRARRRRTPPRTENASRSDRGFREAEAGSFPRVRHHRVPPGVQVRRSGGVPPGRSGRHAVRTGSG